MGGMLLRGIHALPTQKLLNFAVHLPEGVVEVQGRVIESTDAGSRVAFEGEGYEDYSNSLADFIRDHVVGDLERKLTGEPGDARVVPGLAALYRDLGRLDHALDLYHSAIDVISEDPVFLVRLCDFFLTSAQADEEHAPMILDRLEEVLSRIPEGVHTEFLTQFRRDADRLRRRLWGPEDADDFKGQTVERIHALKETIEHERRQLYDGFRALLDKRRALEELVRSRPETVVPSNTPQDDRERQVLDAIKTRLEAMDTGPYRSPERVPWLRYVWVAGMVALTTAAALLVAWQLLPATTRRAVLSESLRVLGRLPAPPVSGLTRGEGRVPPLMSAEAMANKSERSFSADLTQSDTLAVADNSPESTSSAPRVPSDFASDTVDTAPGDFEEMAANSVQERKAKPRSKRNRHRDLWAERLRHRGRRYLRLKQVERATDAFSRVLGEFPQDASAYEGLGQAYLLEGRMTEAVAAFRRFVELAPDHPSSVVARALIDKHREREAAASMAIAPAPTPPAADVPVDEEARDSAAGVTAEDQRNETQVLTPPAKVSAATKSRKGAGKASKNKNRQKKRKSAQDSRRKKKRGDAVPFGF